MESQIPKVLIIGAGPAGIQMAYYLKKEKVSFVVLERSKPNTYFFSQYPRNRRLISINKVHCEDMNDIENVRRFDWNSLLTLEEDNFKCMFRDFSKDYYPSANALVNYLNTFIDTFQLNEFIQYDATVERISKNPSGTFEVEYKHYGKPLLLKDIERVFIATGLQCSHLESYFQTDDYSKEYEGFYFYDTMPMNPDVYRNKKILIIGGGNAAFETANYVNEYCNKLTVMGSERFAYNTHYPGNIRSINMPLLDSYYLKMRVNLNWSRTLYNRDDSFVHNELKKLKYGKDTTYDIIICCTGFVPNMSFIDKKHIHLKTGQRGFPELTAFFESVSCPSLYFIGALSQQHDYKKGTSAFIHGFRYNCKILYEKLFNYQMISTFSATDFKYISDIIFKQINASSALLHRFDYIGDVLLITKNSWIYIQCLPLNSINEVNFNSYTNEPILQILTIYLGYNPDIKFKSKFTQPQVGSSLHYRDESVFIHPRFNIYEYQLQKWIPIYTLKLPEEAFNEYQSITFHHHIIHQFVELLHTSGQIENKSLTKAFFNAYDIILSVRYLRPL